MAVTVTVAVAVAEQGPAVSVTVTVRAPAVSHVTEIVLLVVPVIVRSAAAPDTVQAYVLAPSNGVLYTCVVPEHKARLPVIVGVGTVYTVTRFVYVLVNTHDPFVSVTVMS